jgi:hypothetical protein
MAEPFIQYAIGVHTLSSFDADGTETILTTKAYSGNGQCMNDPEKTWVVGHGPIPGGAYLVCAAEDHPESVGAFALPLTPDPSNDMMGRSSFYIHGDNSAENFTASDGCIVTSREVREICATFQLLEVVA